MGGMHMEILEAEVMAAEATAEDFPEGSRAEATLEVAVRAEVASVVLRAVVALEVAVRAAVASAAARVVAAQEVVVRAAVASAAAALAVVATAKRVSAALRVEVAAMVTVKGTG